MKSDVDTDTVLMVVLGPTKHIYYLEYAPN